VTLDRPVRVGIIGLSARGGWAATSHVPALAALPGYELVALSASSPESTRAAGEAFGVPHVYDDPAALAASDEVDLVVVTVKVSRHHELLVPALRAGKAVLSEWPLGNGLAEAEDLVALAERTGARTAVGLQARSAPALNYVRDLIADGYVGTVLSTSLIGSGSAWGARVGPGQRYTLDESEGVSMLSVPFGHTAAALTMILGEFAEVEARTAIRRPMVFDPETGRDHPMTVPDQLTVTGVLSGGAVAAIHYRGGMSRATNFRWEINGTDGDLVITGVNGHLQFGFVEVAGARGDQSELEPLPTPAEYTLVPALDPATPAYTVGHAYAHLQSDLRDGTRTTPDFADALHTHRLLAAVEEAARTGVRQKL